MTREHMSRWWSRRTLRIGRPPRDVVADGLDLMDSTASAADFEGLEGRVSVLERAAADRHRESLHFAELEGALVRDIAELQPTLQIREHVVALPFMSDPAALRVTDGHGEQTLGFTVASSGGAEGYREFEDLFRGSREQIQDLQRPYIEMLRSLGPILDLGCGRGEFLELLSVEGLDGRGVDLDAGMVAEAVENGLAARVGDLFGELDACAPGSVGGVFSAQVVEHLEPDDMARLFTEVHRVLSSDGVAIIETVNPHSLRALRFFWLDRTHTHPVYPESALMLARAAGFGAAIVHFPGVEGDLRHKLQMAGDFAVICAHSPAVLLDRGLLSE